MTKYVIALPPQPSLAIAGSDEKFPVKRIWCVGRNYEEHIKEMGHDTRDPPFFFAKPSDALVNGDATIPYPPLTKDFQHEIELVVAMKSGGRNIKAAQALDHVWGYTVGLDMTRRDLQIAARKKERPWEVGKSFDHSAPCGALLPAAKVKDPNAGRIVLTNNGVVKQEGDLAQMIWNVQEIIEKLSEMVEIGAGDIIMTGTPSGVAACVPGDRIVCKIDGIGELAVTIGK